jgi:hypothetical protein
MLTDYHGQPVAGGTFPAEIWRAFTEAALARTPPSTFPSYSVSYPVSEHVTWRNGRLQLDNGYCRSDFTLDYFANAVPRRTADCKPNEVDIPTVIGYTLKGAKARLALQPLKANVVYKPAMPGQALDRVVGQYPRTGTASSFDTITLVLAKPLHGIVPKVVGLTLARARARLHARGLGVDTPADAIDTAVVTAQRPRPGVAAGPHLHVKLTLRETAG